MGTNVDLVRSIVAPWERGDYSSAEWADPQLEFVLADLPDAGVRRGSTAAGGTWRDFLDAWDGHHIEVDGFRELDDERVLLLGAFRARGKASDLDLEQVRTEGANVFHVRDGKVTKLVIYFERGHALRDLGIEE